MEVMFILNNFHYDDCMHYFKTLIERQNKNFLIKILWFIDVIYHCLAAVFAKNAAKDLKKLRQDIFKKVSKADNTAKADLEDTFFKCLKKKKSTQTKKQLFFKHLKNNLKNPNQL